ncbi:60Kd inner membrane protein-domain-containing protein [Haematococcus lacustris]
MLRRACLLLARPVGCVVHEAGPTAYFPSLPVVCSEAEASFSGHNLYADSRASLSAGGVRHASSFAAWWPGSKKSLAAAADVPVEEPASFFPLPESSMEAILAIQQALNAEDVAAIAMAKAAAWPNTYWFMQGIQWAHDSLGLQWWAAIAAVNLLTRLITVPLAVMQQKGSANTVVYRHQLVPVQQMQKAAAAATNPAEKQKLLRAAQQAYNEHKAQHGGPWSKAKMMPIAMGGSAIVFLSIFNGVRNLMASKASSLATGGVLWFPDLTLPDPYWGLPLMCSAITIAQIQLGMNVDGTSTEASPTAMVSPRTMKYFMMGCSLLFVPMGSYVSSGVAILWLTNTGFGIAQGALLRQPEVRKLLSMPTMEEMQEMQKAASATQAAAAPAAAAPALTPQQAAVEQAAKAAKNSSGQPLLYHANPALAATVGATQIGARRRAGR